MSSLATQSKVRVSRLAQRTTQAAVQKAKLTVVPDRAAGAAGARRTPFVILVVLLLAGGVAGLLAFNISMQQASFRATKLENQAAALTAKKQSLALELAAQRDPQTLASRAKALGMVPPPDPAFVRLGDGAVLGTPTPATPDDAIRINPPPASKPSSLAPAPLVVKVPATNSGDLPVASTTVQQPGATTKKNHRPHHQSGHQ